MGFLAFLALMFGFSGDLIGAAAAAGILEDWEVLVSRILFNFDGH